MDFELSGFSEAFNMPTLGKRNPMSDLNARQNEELDTVSTKRGKVDSDVGSSDEGLVGVMIHPYQEQ